MRIIGTGTNNYFPVVNKLRTQSVTKAFTLLGLYKIQDVNSITLKGYDSFYEFALPMRLRYINKSNQY